MKRVPIAIAGCCVALAAGALLLRAGPRIVQQLGGIAAPVASYGPVAAPLPFDFFQESRIYLPARINGRPVDALLDSGAGMTVVSQRFADEIGLAGGRTISVNGAGGPVPGRIATNVTVEAGALRLSGLSVLILDLTAVEARIGRPLRVILGREAFEAGIVDVDFAARQLAFRPRRGFAAPAAAAAVPLSRARGGQVTVPVALEGGPEVPAVVDLGHGGAVVVSRAYAERRGLLRERRVAQAWAGAVGGFAPRTVGLLSSLSLGGQLFTNVPAVFNSSAAELPPDGALVGVDLLSRFHVITDYAGGTLYLLATPATLRTPLPHDRSGLFLSSAPDRLRVEFVAPGSPAALAGWVAGDEIVAVNGARVSGDFANGAGARWATGVQGARVQLTRASGVTNALVLRDYY